MQEEENCFLFRTAHLCEFEPTYSRLMNIGLAEEEPRRQVEVSADGITRAGGNFGASVRGE